MFRYSAVLLLTLVFCSGFSNCHLGERFRNFRETIRGEDVIRDTKLIRDAQKAYKGKFNRYGSIKDLIAAGLLSSRFEDGEESESQFVLTFETDHYNLTVTPKAAHSETYNLTLYLDNTGIIRFSENPKKPANSESYPLESQ